MLRYVFNPSLNTPLRFVHPLQAEGLSRFLSASFSEYIDYIFLFGGSLDLSCSPESDLDFYVISEYEPEAVYKEIYDRCKTLGRPFDILVSTGKEFAIEAKEIGTVESRILKEGLCLYAKTQNNIATAS